MRKNAGVHTLLRTFLFLFFLTLARRIPESGPTRAEAALSPPSPEASVSSEARIARLEAHYVKDKSHRTAYALARLYVESGDPGKAEAVLARDLHNKLDPYDAYESCALLIGLSLDQGKEIEERFVARSVRAFDSMKQSIPGDIKRLDRSIAAFKMKEPETKGRELPESRELFERKKRILAYAKDPFQLERMLGDYYFNRSDTERAFSFYGRFYSDLDKPVSSFAARSMRNYAALLLQRNKPGDALRIQGYLVNLKPSMFADLTRLAEMYYQLGDSVSSLLFLMLVNAVAEGSNELFFTESRDRILRLAGELELEENRQGVLELIEIFLTGENASSIPYIVEGLKENGARHFFFDYLEGVAFFVAKEYKRALEHFEAFNRVYPHLADSYYYAMVCMENLDRISYRERIPWCVEEAVALKPGSAVARLAKRTLARSLGMKDEEGEKLLLPREVQSIIESYARRGAPSESIDRLLGALTVTRNPYQVLTIELMGGVDARMDEYITYLKSRYSSLNKNGQEHLREVLSRLGEDR